MKTSLYIHIPYCVSKCSYCDFFSISCGKKSVPDEYVNALCNEIKIKKEEKKINFFETIYIGGGTPSLLSKNQICKIISSALCGLNEKPKEITIECNPDDITKELLESFSFAGINRLSVGIQTFNENSLKFVERRSSLKQVFLALEIIKKNWKGIFSADLISALPEETEKSFKKTLKNLLKYKPNHISMYSLTIEPSTPLGKSLSSGKLFYDFEKADSLWIYGRNFLQKKGYIQYEVSNFCKKGFECAHNLVYWRLENYEGCGAGATGTIYGENGIRFTNTNDIQNYISFWNSCNAKPENAPGIKEELSLETQSFEFFMMGLRTLRGISEEEYRRRFNSALPEKFINEFNLWKKKKLAHIKIINKEHFYSLTKKGILFLNDFLESLL